MQITVNQSFIVHQSMSLKAGGSERRGGGANGGPGSTSPHPLLSASLWPSVPPPPHSAGEEAKGACAREDKSTQRLCRSPCPDLALVRRAARLGPRRFESSALLSVASRPVQRSVLRAAVHNRLARRARLEIEHTNLLLGAGWERAPAEAVLCTVCSRLLLKCHMNIEGCVALFQKALSSQLVLERRSAPHVSQLCFEGLLQMVAGQERTNKLCKTPLQTIHLCAVRWP